jgi:hypothetical protein
MIAATDAIPQGVNFAIQSPIVLNFFSVKGVKATFGGDSDKLDPADLAELAKQFTVQVLCDDAGRGFRPSAACKTQRRSFTCFAKLGMRSRSSLLKID